jgi:hypothetical protein
MSRSETARKKTNHRREAAILALISHRTYAEAAEASGIPVGTLKRWAADPSFKHELRAAQRETFLAAMDELKSLAREAIAVVRASLADDSPALRLKAALGALDRIIRVWEASEIEQRLRALEEEVGK